MEFLIYFLVWAGLFFLMMRFGCGAHVMGHKQKSSERTNEKSSAIDRLRWIAPERDTDPVCRKIVHTDRAKPSVQDGSVYYFCSRECRERFEAAPDLHLKPSTEGETQQQEHAHV